MAELSLVIPLMRKPAIYVVLDHYLYRCGDLIDELIVVDFDYDYTRENGPLPTALNLKFVPVKKMKRFNKSFAINVGCYYTRNETIIVCDADFMIASHSLEKWASKADVRQGGVCYYIKYVHETEKTKRPLPGYGICMFNKQNLLQIQGYDSQFKGWGFDDMDYLSRLVRAGVRLKTLGEGLHISHDDIERTINFGSTDLQAMKDANWRRFKNRYNMKDLYGTFDTDVKQYLQHESAPLAADQGYQMRNSE